jgi:hypothetical protein
MVSPKVWSNRQQFPARPAAKAARTWTATWSGWGADPPAANTCTAKRWQECNCQPEELFISKVGALVVRAWTAPTPLRSARADRPASPRPGVRMRIGPHPAGCKCAFAPGATAAQGVHAPRGEYGRPQIRPRDFTASRSEASSATVASIFSREKSLISTPSMISQAPLSERTGNEEIRPSGTP